MSGFFYGRSLRSGYPLYSRLTKTTAKMPCFSKSGDTAPIPNAHSCKLRFLNSNLKSLRTLAT